jgi:acyl-CoA dehydrogenase
MTTAQTFQTAPYRAPTGTIPAVEPTNLFADDKVGQAYFAHTLGAAGFDKYRGHFDRLGEAGRESFELAALADRNPPTLRTHSPQGDRIDAVDYHASYRHMEVLAYGGGIVGAKFTGDLVGADRAIRHGVGFGAGYYFAQVESGMYCPICMTDGVARILEMHTPADPFGRDVAQRTIAHLATRDRAELWRGAMFLTEIQGGSDVGANAVVAKPDADAFGGYRLFGDKWFCSNVDAEAILALARLPDAPAGTRGLGLFLVLRHEPTGNFKNIRIHRLKPKFGTRSMPTGEVTLEGAEAVLIGGVNQGFKMMADMLNLSRLYNAVASVAGAKRALFEAARYGEGRRAFGEKLWDLPLWRAVVADMAAEQFAGFVLTFETVRSLDRADTGDAEGAKLARILTPIAKATMGKLAVALASEAVETVGGNGYIEESPLPRVLRDNQVLPIWEGTTNILSLDTLRAVGKEQAHEALFGRIREAIRAGVKAAGGGTEAVQPRAQAELLRAALEDLGARLGTLAADPALAQRLARGWLEDAGRLTSQALLFELAGTATDPLLAWTAADALARVHLRPQFATPFAATASAGLTATEPRLLAYAAAR